MVIYALLSLVSSYFTYTRNQTKSWESGYKKLAGICCHRLQRWQIDCFADRVVLPVTAEIYRNGEEKPAMHLKWE